MTIDEDVAQAGVECDDRFDRQQPQLIADLRRQGVTDAEMPAALAWAHAAFWRERCALQGRLRALLERMRALGLSE